MKFSKILASSLAAIMVLALAACSSSSSTAPTTSSTGDANSTATSETKWPTKTVTVTLPYNAGGDTDTYCRLMAARLQEMFGQNFVVVNMTGGSGIVAAKDTMAKANDGYNILFNHTGASLVQEATGVADFSYVDDFDTVATIAQDNSYTLIAKASSGWKTLEDMITEAKANPGTIRYSQVYGSVTHYVVSQMEKSMGIELNKLDVGTGTAERLAAFMGEQVDLLAVNFMNVADYVENGDFVVLGVCSEERVPGMDEFPTFKEQGYNVVSAKYYEIKFPKGTDTAIIEKLSAAIETISQEADFAENLSKYYAEPYFRNSEDSVTQDRAEVEALKLYFAE